MTWQNIVGTYLQSTPTERQHGERWYTDAREICSRIQHPNLITPAAAIVAALSPNNRWQRNVLDAERLINECMEGGSPDNVRVTTYNANKAKAVALIKAQTLEIPQIREILSGPKVVEFYNCIMGYPDVCIDGHAYSVWAGERIPTTKTPSIGVKLRQSIKDSYTYAADTLNGFLGTTLTASQVQATTWVTHKRVYN